MSNSALDQLQDILSDGDNDISQAAATRLVLSEVAALNRLFCTIDARLVVVEADVHSIKAYQTNHPTLLWLLRYKFKRTSLAIVGIFILLGIVVDLDLKDYLLSLLGFF